MSEARRTFLKSTAAAGGLLIVSPKTAFSYQANSTVELGIVGCGGRGTWISDLFLEYALVRFVALADAFDQPVEALGAKLKVDTSRLYRGVNGYKDLVASKLDGVVIETPPYFRPEQVEASVNAGKHVYMAKPVAVDVPGCKSILASGEKARGRLSYLVDFQTRARPVFQEAVQRVHNGQIGAPVFGHVYYHAGSLTPHKTEGLTPEQATLKNWLHDRRLSGDIIVEQNIHVIDVANWYLNSNPLRAIGTGGQNARFVGDQWDNYQVTYWYPNDAKVDFSSVQFSKGYGDLCIRMYGAKGTVDSHYGGLVRITGEEPWTGAEKDPTFREGTVTNVKDWVDSIRSGKYLNNTVESVNSNLAAVLGRMAAVRGRVVTWDEMMQTTDRWDGKTRG
jgi:myo-inositol 2-dehydrogenase / D-chiro-inositol 1-dehydrogenase